MITLSLNLKEQKVMELSSIVTKIEKKAEELNRLKAAEVSWPMKMERILRKKIIYPVKCKIRTYYLKLFPRIFCNSIPKSGTHLLSQVLTNMGFITKFRWIHDTTTLDDARKVIERHGKYEFLYGHKCFDKEMGILLKQHNISHLLIVRDPRDVVVSRAFFIPKSSEHVLCSYFNSLNKRERFVTSIKGVPGSLPGVAERFNEYIPWLNDENCLVIKFEDLIGSRGGGSDEKQLETLKQIAKHSGTFFKESKLQEVSQKSFSENSPTFRKGQIGDWVNWLDDEMLEILRKDKDIFEKFGYTL